MNARDRIARALFLHEKPHGASAWDRPSAHGKEAWLGQADAVIGILPYLLADPQVVEAATAAAISEAGWDWPEEHDPNDGALRVPSPMDAMRDTVVAALVAAGEVIA